MASERGSARSTARAHADGIQEEQAYSDWATIIGAGMTSPESREVALKKWIEQADGILKGLSGGENDR